MSDSTPNIPHIAVSQLSKEVTANGNFDMASQAMIYGRNPVTTGLLTWGYVGGRYNSTPIANGTVTLTPSATNYIVASKSTGAVSISTTDTNWNDTDNYERLYLVVVGAATATSYEDHRNFMGGGVAGGSTTDIAAQIVAATAKTTPADADLLALVDSAASNVLKKLSWANLKATLKTHFDTLYAPASQPFDIHTFRPGVPAASAKMYRGRLARAVTFPANFAGSQFTASVSATSSTVIDIQKNGSPVGTCTIAAGGVTPTFASSGGAAVTFAAGDILSVICPSTADATLADPAITLTGTR